MFPTTLPYGLTMEGSEVVLGLFFLQLKYLAATKKLIDSQLKDDIITYLTLL